MQTEYEKELIPKILKLHLEVWYKIDPNRPDRKDFVEAIKKRIDSHDDFLFNEDYSKFKHVKPFNPDYTGEITYKIEYLYPLVQLPYDHLPEPKYTETNKIVKRRAT